MRGLVQRSMRLGAMQAAAWALVLALLFGAAPGAGAQSFWDELLAGFESSIGAAVAEDVRAEYGPPARLSAARQRGVDAIFADIVLQAGRKDIAYSLQVLESDVVNAFAAPGGYIFLTTALLHHIGDDVDALANVLGHEVAHVEHKHGMNALGRNLGISLLLQLAFGNPSEGDEVWQAVAGVAVGLMQLGWSRDQEHESDELGQRLAAAAGYDPQGMVRFFRVLEGLQGMEVPFLEFLSTHPLTSERISRAENRAQSLPVRPRTAPKPSLPGGGSSGVGPVTRPGPARIGEGASGPIYDDPAARFSLRLPADMVPEPTLYLEATRFDGPGGGQIWVFVQPAERQDRTARLAADRVLRRYGETLADFEVISPPRSATLAGGVAEYAEYRYRGADGTFLREGGWFLLRGGLLYMLQFAEPAARFDARRNVHEAAAASFAVGSGGPGRVDGAALTRQAASPVSVAGLFTMTVSELWPLTWERPVGQSAADSPQVAEFTEIGRGGYMSIFQYGTKFFATARDTAGEWLALITDARTDVRIVEPLRTRRIGGYDAASFLVTWTEGGRRWAQYATTIVLNWTSWEIGIIYPADGFDERRAAFDVWIESWRPGGF